MFFTSRARAAAFAAALLLSTSAASAQINFAKSGYYLSMGDSIAAGEGALPVTNGFAYELYNRGAFGRIQTMDFSNIGVKGITTQEVLDLQVYQALCIQKPRIGMAPTVITLTAGANDFFLFLAPFVKTGSTPTLPELKAAAVAIAGRVADTIRMLVFGLPTLPPYCAQSGLPGISVLVFNYYSFNHPDPQIDALLDFTLESFTKELNSQIQTIRTGIQATGRTARVGLVDTFSAMHGRTGLLLIERRNGFTSPWDFEIHPTNAGHAVIAREFERVWHELQEQ